RLRPTRPTPSREAPCRQRVSTASASCRSAGACACQARPRAPSQSLAPGDRNSRHPLLQYAVLLADGAQARKSRMSQRPAEIGADTRQMAKIGRFAVTPVKPHEYSKDLGVSLCGHDGVGFAKLAFPKGSPGAPGSDIGIQRVLLYRLGNGDARIHCQGGNIVGTGADERVLVVEYAQPVMPGAIATPEDVGRVEIAQDERLFAALQAVDQGSPGPPETVTQALAGGWAGHGRHVPVHQQFRLGHHGVAIDGWPDVAHAAPNHDLLRPAPPVHAGK